MKIRKRCVLRAKITTFRTDSFGDETQVALQAPFAPSNGYLSVGSSLHNCTGSTEYREPAPPCLSPAFIKTWRVMLCQRTQHHKEPLPPNTFLWARSVLIYTSPLGTDHITIISPGAFNSFVTMPHPLFTPQILLILWNSLYSSGFVLSSLFFGLCTPTFTTLHICKVQRVPQPWSTVNKSQRQHRVTTVLFPPSFSCLYHPSLRRKEKKKESWCCWETRWLGLVSGDITLAVFLRGTWGWKCKVGSCLGQGGAHSLFTLKGIVENSSKWNTGVPSLMERAESEVHRRKTESWYRATYDPTELGQGNLHWDSVSPSAKWDW